MTSWNILPLKIINDLEFRISNNFINNVDHQINCSILYKKITHFSILYVDYLNSIISNHIIKFECIKLLFMLLEIFKSFY
jgi:hypothetical protein